MDYWYILWGFLILAGLGGVLGVLLVLAEHFLHVEEDPRIADVEKMLPNGNCGACGFPGCHGMAEALVSGTVKKCSTCKVGKKDKNFDPIIVYLASHPDQDGTKHVPTL
jgi:Na+-translocating ferredoxin:NAD+ oxidoreductase subunit B